MEKECDRCKTRFNATSEAQSVCAKCLSAEFDKGTTGSAPLVGAEAVEFRRMQRRQKARAEKMQRMLESGAMFSNRGKVRGVLALALFLACSFVFFLGDSETMKTPVNQLDIEYQLIISIGCGLISACCLLPSFRNNKAIISSLIVMILGWSVAVPFVWHARTPDEEAETLPVDDGIMNAAEDEQVKRGPVMTDGDLEVFRTVCAEAPRQTHYAIYMDSQTSNSRLLIRESLTRLLQSEYTRAYTRGRGALFVVVNSRVSRAQIPVVLARYGQVSYSRADKGIYELHFSAERAKLVSRYSADVLESPHNPNFVAANVSELTCLDPMRVRVAANMLAGADVQVLRVDIKNALLRVLQDPWLTEPDTYQALVEALVVYAPAKDAMALRVFRTYFEHCRQTSRGLSAKVVRRLVAEDPDGMVAPVVSMWIANPVAWAEIIPLLGNRVEDALLARVTPQSDLQILDGSLKFFADFGSERAVPLVEALVGHQDALISHKATQTLAHIKKRLAN